MLETIKEWFGYGPETRHRMTNAGTQVTTLEGVKDEHPNLNPKQIARLYRKQKFKARKAHIKQFRGQELVSSIKFLKVKIKSLADEARAIRLEEVKAKWQYRWANELTYHRTIEVAREQ